MATKGKPERPSYNRKVSPKNPPPMRKGGCFNCGGKIKKK